MTEWDDRLEMIIRGDVGRFAHLWSGHRNSVSSDQRPQAIVRQARAILARDFPQAEPRRRVSAATRTTRR